MPEVPLSRRAFPGFVEGPVISPLNLMALAIQGMNREVWATYESALGSLQPVTPGLDRKAIIRFQRTLRDHETLGVLQFIWKESSYLSDAELQAAGLVRVFFDRPLTCWGLAQEIAVTAHDLGKVHKRILAVVKAGACYDLIETEKIRTKLVGIKGSKQLHDFMVELSVATEKVIRAAMQSCSGTGPG